MGVDYRKPEYREQVFQDFYEFHLRYRSHPGCVYYLMPYLKEKLNWSPNVPLIIGIKETYNWIKNESIKKGIWKS